MAVFTIQKIPSDNASVICGKQESSGQVTNLQTCPYIAGCRCVMVNDYVGEGLQPSR